MTFPDHFSALARSYVRFRPGYPAPLFDWIAAAAPTRHLAWDCGCGSGQATLSLAHHFDHVVGTDASAEQIAQAPALPNVTWRVAPAEASGLDSHSIAAIVVAQALHWFDLSRFWDEVRRVAVPGALFCAWTYGVPALGDPALSAALRHFHDDVVGPWWPIERGHVDNRYRGIALPVAPVTVPTLDLQASWTLDRFAGYLRTWSAVRRYLEGEGSDPVAPFVDQLRPRWGAGEREIVWPMTILAGRVP